MKLLKMFLLLAMTASLANAAETTSCILQKWEKGSTTSALKQFKLNFSEYETLFQSYVDVSLNEAVYGIKINVNREPSDPYKINSIEASIWEGGSDWQKYKNRIVFSYIRGASSPHDIQSVRIGGLDVDGGTLDLLCHFTVR